MAATTAFVESSGIVVSVGAGILAALFALSQRFTRSERAFFGTAVLTLLGSAFCGSTGVLGMLFLPVTVVVSTVLVFVAVRLALQARGSGTRMSALLLYALLFSVPLVSIVMMLVWLVGEGAAGPGLNGLP